MALPPHFLEELRSRVSLASVVSRHVRLTRRGREYVGLCPFHKEKTPSFAVVEDKNFYHCFGCGAHGDVVGFTMRLSNMGFREAVESLAKEAGLQVPSDTPRDREREARALSLNDACEAACEFYEQQLRGAGGNKALEYLKRRGLDDGVIAQFRLGWAPDTRESLKRFLHGRFPEELLVTAGLLRKAESGSSYDFFRGRVIFPIADRNGKIIAFGGRLVADGQPKYLNSPDTPIFDKGRTLYGLHLAKSVRSESAPIVVEGYTDVIALYQAGFKGAVAPLGTALTEQHLFELWKLGPEPIICFDGDSAGQKAANRALDRALPSLRPDFSLRFATLPEKDDPDSLIKANGPSSFGRYLAAAIPVSEFMWRSATEQKDASYFSTPEKISRLQARLTKRISLVGNGILQKNYRDFVGDRIWDLKKLLRRSRELKKGYTSTELRLLSQDQRWTGKESRQRHLEIILVAMAINQPTIVREDIDSFAMLEIAHSKIRELWQSLLERIAREPEIDAVSLRQQLPDDFGDLINAIFDSQTYKGRTFAHFNAEKEWAMMGWRATLAKYRLPGLEDEREKALERYTADMTDDNWTTLMMYREMVAQHTTESEFSKRHWEGAFQQDQETPAGH